MEDGTQLREATLLSLSPRQLHLQSQQGRTSYTSNPPDALNLSDFDLFLQEGPCPLEGLTEDTLPFLVNCAVQHNLIIEAIAHYHRRFLPPQDRVGTGVGGPWGSSKDSAYHLDSPASPSSPLTSLSQPSGLSDLSLDVTV